MSINNKSFKPEEIVLCTNGLTRIFGTGKKHVTAVDNVTLCFYKNEIISIVGESGSGKTTLMMMIMGLLSPTNGTIKYNNLELNRKNKNQMRAYWKHVQAIFQDPFTSFNQFFKVSKVFNDCFRFKGISASKQEKLKTIENACKFVNLEYSELENKYPFELSGGQMQRLMIARIFIIEPQILIADEPTSMIDACSRSTILEMLFELRQRNGMTIIFITHDLGLAYYISDKIYIMQKGCFVESGPADTIIQNPKTEYTRHLLNDVPKMHEEWILDVNTYTN